MQTYFEGDQVSLFDQDTSGSLSSGLFHCLNLFYKRLFENQIVTISLFIVIPSKRTIQSWYVCHASDDDYFFSSRTIW